MTIFYTLYKVDEKRKYIFTPNHDNLEKPSNNSNNNKKMSDICLPPPVYKFTISSKRKIEKKISISRVESIIIQNISFL